MHSLSEKEQLKGFKNLKKYIGYFFNYKLLITGYWSSLILTGIISFISPLVLGKVISAMTVTQDFQAAKTYAVLFFIVETVNQLVYLIRVPFFKKLENYVKRDAKINILGSSFKINIEEYEKLGNGTFITRLTSDLDSLSNSFKNISDTIINFMSRIGFIIFVFIVNFWLGAFLVLFILLRYFIYQIRIHYYAKLKPEVLKRQEATNAMVGEAVRGIQDIKTLDLDDNILDRVKDLQTDYLKKDNQEWYVGISLSTLASFASILCNLFFIILCVYLIEQGHLDLAIFYSVYVYKNSVMDFAVHLGNLQDYFKDMEVSANRVFALADDSVYSHEKYGDKHLDNYEGGVEFKDVCFDYEDGDVILDKVSFKIKPKTHVAFVGASGCGKSTIVSLICRLYHPQSGTVSFDGIDGKDLDEDFNKNISMINQAPYVFNLTIKENMQLVKKDVTDEEIYEVLRLANAYEFVDELPNKLDSFLGEGGARLSGGQRQRICIARALLKGSKIVVFDEATSALDNISQQYVMNSVDELKKNHTIITIAHRLTTIENCDEIFFVNDGKIIDSGTHQYLLENNKTYARLYKTQLKEKKDENN